MEQDQTIHTITSPCRMLHTLTDHTLVSANLLQLVTETKTLEPHYTNSSDHLPISISLNVSKADNLISANHDQNLDTDYIPDYLWKNKTFLCSYNHLVTHSLMSQTTSSNAESSINLLQDTLRKCAVHAYEKLKTNKDFHFISTKRWWNEDHTKKRKILQTMFNHWRSEGFPKNKDNTSFNRYIFARKAFRTLIRTCKNQATTEHYVNIEKIKDINPKAYWKKIRLAKRSTNKLFTINNKSTTDTITKEFNQHFSHLLNTPRTDGIDNTNTNKQLNNLLQELENNTSVDYIHITETDVINAVNSLNKGKARDPFDLQAEHFIPAMNDQTTLYLANVINSILHADNLPPSLAKSLIIPLVKSYRKPMSDPNNYRGISLIPILTKIIEKIIINRCPELKEHKNNQFGFASDASTIHAELLIQDTLLRYNTMKSPVYVCSLDAEKAFDCCNWLLLFKKLVAKKVIPNTIIKFLIKLYLLGEASTKYKGTVASPFRLSQGVRQGSILSPYLYNIYTEDIIDKIQKKSIGTYLPGPINTSIIAFADDLILLSLKQLQLMLTECELFGFKNGIRFNDTKTQFVISGKCPIPNPTLSLNGKTIAPKDELKHLGYSWKANHTSKLTLHKHQNACIAELWATTSSLISCGVRKMHPNIIVSIFKKIILPKIMYGLEIAPLSRSFMDLLDIQCRCSLKLLLGLSKHSSNDINKFYNLNNVSDIVNTRRINLLLLLMKNSTWWSYYPWKQTRDFTQSYKVLWMFVPRKTLML